VVAFIASGHLSRDLFRAEPVPLRGRSEYPGGRIRIVDEQ